MRNELNQASHNCWLPFRQVVTELQQLHRIRFSMVMMVANTNNGRAPGQQPPSDSSDHARRRRRRRLSWAWFDDFEGDHSISQLKPFTWVLWDHYLIEIGFDNWFFFFRFAINSERSTYWDTYVIRSCEGEMCWFLLDWSKPSRTRMFKKMCVCFLIESACNALLLNTFYFVKLPILHHSPTIFCWFFFRAKHPK